MCATACLPADVAQDNRGQDDGTDETQGGTSGSVPIVGKSPEKKDE